MVFDDGTDAIVFALLVVCLAAVVMAAAACCRAPERFLSGPRRAWESGHFWHIAALAANTAVKSVCFAIGLDYVAALNAAVYIPVIPIAALLLSRGLGWEGPLLWRQWGGVALAVGGALLVTAMRYSGETDSGEGATKILVGNLLLLAWVLAAAAAIVLQRPLLRHHAPDALAAYVLAGAGLLLAASVPWAEVGHAGRWDLSGLAWGAVAYSAAYNALAGWADALAVTLVAPSVVAMWLVLEPPLTALLAWAACGDTMTGWEYAGSALTCCGLVLVLYDVEVVAEMVAAEAGEGAAGREKGAAATKPEPTDSTPLLSPLREGAI